MSTSNQTPGSLTEKVFATEAVSPSHPDKIADRIAGALIDLTYQKAGLDFTRADDKNFAEKFAEIAHPKAAFEILIGHGQSQIIAETSIHLDKREVDDIVAHLSGEKIATNYLEVPQDVELAKNQADNAPRAGDNGIFYGAVPSEIHVFAKNLARKIYEKYPFDGKLVVHKPPDDNEVSHATICWSHATAAQIREIVAKDFPNLTALNINPLGDWTGGVNVDTGAIGRKLAVDFYGLAAPLGGGNPHGKDLTKSDVSVNIAAFLFANNVSAKYGDELNRGVFRAPQNFVAQTAIGDQSVTFTGSDGVYEIRSFPAVVALAANYIYSLGGFEKFAEWGLRL